MTAASRRRGRRAVENDVHVRLASRLTARDRWVIRMLAEHRVLTTTQLDQLAFTGPPQRTNPRPSQTSPARPVSGSASRAAQLRLRTLAELGVIDRFRLPTATGTGSTAHHWVTTGLSFAVLAAEDGNPQPATQRRTASRTPSRAASTAFLTAQPTGQPVLPGPWGVALAHNQQLHHQVGTNACLVGLISAQPHPHLHGGHAVGQVRLWWGQARAGRHLSPARPDAYALWTNDAPTPSPPAPARTLPLAATSAALAFALEYDTGTEPLHRVAGKLAGYHALALATTITTPVLFWLPSPRREANLRAALADALAALPAPRLVPIATASPHPDLPGQGWHPHAPIWAPLIVDQPRNTLTPHQRTSPWPDRARLSLAQLAATLGPPSHTHHDRTLRNGVDLSAHRSDPVDAIRITHSVQVPGRADLYSEDLAIRVEPDHHDAPGHGAGHDSGTPAWGFASSAPWWPPSPIAPEPADTRFPHTTPADR